MEAPQYTPRAQQILALARKELIRLHHTVLEPEHFLWGMLALNQGVAVNVLHRMGIDFAALRQALEKAAPPGEVEPIVGNVPYSPRAKQVLTLATEEAKKLGHSYVGTEHVLTALIVEGTSQAAAVLKECGVDLYRTYQEILKELAPPTIPASSACQHPGALGSQSSNPLSRGDNLTSKARAGVIKPILGRQSEIGRMMQVLSRRDHNSVLLAGKPGIGKSAVLKGLAREFADCHCPPNLFGKNIIGFTMVGLLTDAIAHPGRDAWLRKVFDFAAQDPQVILGIEEVFSSGGEGIEANFFHLLHSVLLDGHIQFIFTVSARELQNLLRSQRWLESLVHVVSLEALPSETICEIVGQGVLDYEKFHQIHFTPEARRLVIALSRFCFPDKSQPGSSFWLLDEIGARVRVKSSPPPPAVLEVQQKLTCIREQKELAIKNQSFDQAAAAREEEKRLKSALDQLIENWRQQGSNIPTTIDENIVYQLTSEISGIAQVILMNRDERPPTMS
jgi:ATP-dependent Clp protease ATP-binding subunit ClpC